MHKRGVLLGVLAISALALFFTYLQVVQIERSTARQEEVYEAMKSLKIAPATATVTAKADLSCAPNDGSAVIVNLPVDEKSYLALSLWGESLTQVNASTTSVAFAGNSDDNSKMGSAKLCPVAVAGKKAAPCTDLEVNVQLNQSDVKVGSTLTGAVMYREDGKEQMIPFTSVIETPKKPVVCI